MAMNNENPPYDSPSQLEIMAAGIEPEFMGPKEDLYVSGVRTTQLDIHVVRSSQYDPGRDATLLYAHLSTALDPNTWVQFCSLVLSENQDQIMARVMKQLNQMSSAASDSQERKPKKSKPKTPPPTPEDE